MLSPIYLMNASAAFNRGYEDGFDSFRVERTNPYQVGSFSHTDYDAGFAYGVDDSLQSRADDAYAAEAYAQADAVYYGVR
jgi:hypothetical protein